MKKILLLFSIIWLCAVFTPPVAVAQAPTLGIGLIVDTADYDRISYDVYQFFVDNPITINSVPMKVMLVDDPYQTDYAITGIFSYVQLLEYKPGTTEANGHRHKIYVTLKLWKNKKLEGTVRDSLDFVDFMHELAQKKEKNYKDEYKSNSSLRNTQIFGNVTNWEDDGSNYKGKFLIDKHTLNVENGLIKAHQAITALSGGNASTPYNFSNTTYRKFTFDRMLEMGEFKNKKRYTPSKYQITKMSSVIPGYATVWWTDEQPVKDKWIQRLPVKTDQIKGTVPSNSLAYLEDFFTTHYRLIMAQEYAFCVVQDGTYLGSPETILPPPFVAEAAPLFFPKFANPGAPLFLEHIAKQQGAIGNKAQEAHYYQSALLLTNGLNASTPVKIDMRKRCLQGLAATAAERNQPFYSSLLSLDTKLSDAYLNSQAAKSDDSLYYAAMAEIHKQLLPVDKSVEETLKALEAEQLSRKLGWVSFAGQILTTGSVLSKSLDYADKEREKKVKIMDVKAQTKIAKSLTGNTQNSDFLAKLRNDINEIEFGKTFIGKDVQFFLLENEQKTLGILQEFAQDKPQLKQLLQTYDKTKNDSSKLEALSNISQKIIEYERVCRLYECKGSLIPEEYLQSGK